MDSNIKLIIDRLDQDRTQDNNPTWNISPETGQFLHTLIGENNLKAGLEIGTSTGYSALWFADAFRHTNGSLITVESHEKRFTEASQNIANAHAEHLITQIKGHAPEILPEIPGTFDFIFFDATKHEHISYFEALKNRIQKNGFIITDNACSHEETLQDYKTLLESLPGFKTHLNPIGTGLLIAQKK